jgi:prolyl-tRNA editing enzyme YbaK/EbsC (Cys-tRNA(Pro) deacylase)
MQCHHAVNAKDPGTVKALPPASRALDDLAIKHEVFRHAGIVVTLDQAARERGQRPEQVVRSLLFRLGPGRFVLVLAAGPNQISWKKLRKHVGQRRLTAASDIEVFEVTGYRVGTVSPFGVRKPVRILIDLRVLREALVSVGSGAANTGIVLTTENLLRALPSAELVDLAIDS